MTWLEYKEHSNLHLDSKTNEFICPSTMEVKGKVNSSLENQTLKDSYCLFFHLPLPHSRKTHKYTVFIRTAA